MIKISDTVTSYIQQDDIALEALRLGILNLSAYAKKLQPLLEEKLYKKVHVGTIVTALSRLASHLEDIPSLRPEVFIEDIHLKSGLTEIAFEKNAATIKTVEKIQSTNLKRGAIFSIVQGVSELTLIITNDVKSSVVKYFRIKPNGVYPNLNAITIHFKESEYIEVPNMIYSLISALAAKRVNIIEIISSFTEISFLVKEMDVQITVDGLRKFFHTPQSEDTPIIR